MARLYAAVTHSLLKEFPFISLFDLILLTSYAGVHSHRIPFCEISGEPETDKLFMNC
jgi:hypothetical protein